MSDKDGELKTDVQEPVFEDLHPADDADDPLPLEKGDRRRARDDDPFDGVDLDDPLDDDEDDEPRGRADRLALDDDEEDEDDDEGEGESYSKRVRSRIKRERELKDRFRDLAASAMQERDRALAELEKARKGGGGGGQSAKEIEARIADVRTKLRQAKEDGESEKEIELEEQLLDLRVDLREAKRAEAAGDRGGGQETETRRPVPANPYAEEFRHRHRRWWGSSDPRAVKLREKVQLIDAQVARDMRERGVTEYDERYWRELDRRLARELPEQFGRRRGGPDRPRSPSIGQRRVPNGGGRRVERLDRDDVATMRTFGLDPNNPDHVKEFRANRSR